MKIIKINTTKKYDVFVGENLLSQAGVLISNAVPVSKIAIITDDNVDKLYSKTLESALIAQKFEVIKYVVKNGEHSKNAENYLLLLDFLANNKLHRNDSVVALGGGVIGDLAGFVAGTYMRGIRFIQIPTTLLAGIDSSVGGKMAINLDAGKNYAGVTYQPSIVIFDTNTINTLPKDVYYDGLGEGVKYAIIKGGKMFEHFNNGIDKNNLEEVICGCIKIKKTLVEKDEEEQNVRKFLNLGHTFAHAFERMSDYSITHGKCVAMGINEIARISNAQKYLSDEAYTNIKKMLEKNCLSEAINYDKEKLIECMLMDKKVEGNNVIFVIIEKIGRCRTVSINKEKLMEFIG